MGGGGSFVQRGVHPGRRGWVQLADDGGFREQTGGLQGAEIGVQAANEGLQGAEVGVRGAEMGVQNAEVGCRQKRGSESKGVQ